MHDLEYAVGVGCWLALIYLIAVYNFGNISPFVAVATPIITISIVYIVIILVNILVKTLFWLLNLMFSPEIVLFIVGIFLLALFGFIIKETAYIIYSVPSEVD
jgi:hypothetical protein